MTKTTIAIQFAPSRARTKNCHITTGYQSQVSYQTQVLEGYPDIENSLFWNCAGIKLLTGHTLTSYWVGL